MATLSSVQLMLDNRNLFRVTDGGKAWSSVYIEELKPGDTFVTAKDRKVTKYKATAEPTVDGSGVWRIDCEELK